MQNTMEQKNGIQNWIKHIKNASFWDIKSNVLCLYLYVLRVGGDGGVDNLNAQYTPLLKG